MSKLLITADLSKPVVLGGAPRVLFFLLTLMPDGSAVANVVRRLKLVLDISGSMGWEAHSGRAKIDELKDAILTAIDGLPDTDIISVYTFNETGEHPVATMTLVQVRKQAKDIIRRLYAGGGTALSPALTPAMNSLTGTGVERIVIVTDGDMTVGDKASEHRRCYRLVEAQGAAPVWVLGIGRDYDDHFLSELARRGHAGSFYSHARDAAELSAYFADYAARMSSSGAITKVDFALSTLNGASIRNAWRLIPDQAGLTLDLGGQRTTYQMDTLDLYGQQILVELEVPTQNLGLGDFEIAEFTVAYNDPTPQREYRTVTVTVTNDEAAADPVNPQVMGTMYTVRGTMMATLGNVSDAQTMFTRAANTMPGGTGQQMLNTLNTLSSGDENDARAAKTMLTQHATRFRPLSS